MDKVKWLEDRIQQQRKCYEEDIVEMRTELFNLKNDRKSSESNTHQFETKIAQLQRDLAIANDKAKALERTAKEQYNQVDLVIEDQEYKRQELEKQMKRRMEDRESELRQVKIDLQASQSRHDLEIERLVHKHQAELSAL